MNLPGRFLKEVGEDKIFYIESDYLPLVITVNWFKGRDRDGVIHTCYPFLLYKTGSTVKGYWNATKYSALSEEIFDRYVVGKLEILSFTKEFETICQRIDSLYDSYYGHRETRNEEEMLQLLQSVNETFLALTDITLAFDAVDQDIIKRVLQKNVASIDLGKIWHASEVVDFASFELRNNEEVLVEQSSQPERLQHLFSNYTHIPSLEETKELVLGLARDELRREVTEKRAELEHNKVEKRKRIETLTNEEQRILKFVDWSSWVRDVRKTAITKVDVLFLNLVGDLYEQWGLARELASVSLVYQVLAGKEAVLAQKEVLQARSQKMVVLYEGDDQYFEDPSTTDEDMKAIDNTYLEQNKSSDLGTVRGEVASKGRAVGAARIVTEKSQFADFKAGEVLVTGMTRPELVPLMKLASAIVTDEGGITSHAAIVSRELKKPCVIGTKVATKIFRNGDVVDVDADRGVVRKIG